MKPEPIPGIYDQVIDNELRRRLVDARDEFVAGESRLSRTEAGRRLARHFAALLNRALDALDDGSDSVARQVELCNRLILFLGAEVSAHGDADIVTDGDLFTPDLLQSLVRADSLTSSDPPLRPSLPLVETHLLVNSRGEHQVGYEIEREIASADRVDLLCSFLLWGGYRRLQPAINAFLARPGCQMRVITTVYCGITEPRVLDALSEAGASIRISYDARRTRLHAKAWLFHRNSGFPTAYIGSSNLSAAALSDGLEWNVRIGGDTGAVLEKFEAAFDGYWNDTSFEAYDPTRDAERLRTALKLERPRSGSAWFQVELRPLPFQMAILERLRSEREVHGRWRNLVVAATGTGKTVIAAFDYRRLRAEFRALHGRWPTLLFVAHRQEILEQALATFRHVLQDPSFGDLLVGGHRPTGAHQLFASIQSLGRIPIESTRHDEWDVVVVDEFHHAAADSYDRWLEHLRPWVLLGLTATPERADGKSITHWFGDRFAAELRLWDAIEQGLLAPFHYFALRDPVDLTPAWRRSHFEPAALDKLLSGHDARATRILSAVGEYVAHPESMRAIAFCVSQSHARFMCEHFRRSGLRAETALADDDDRATHIRSLRDGDVQVLCTVDVLGEGVDIPEVDTVLMLRPTESPTVFLQQLGRGLRIADGKRALTVLDFVETPDREFRLDRRFRALIPGSRRSICTQAEMGFPFLPPGCSIQLTEDVRERVLSNLRAALPQSSRALVEEAKALGPSTRLARFLEETGLEIEELYRKRSLGELRRQAGVEVLPAGPNELELGRTLSKLVGLDDPDILDRVATDCQADAAPEPAPEWFPVLATMFGNAGFADAAGSLANLWRHPAVRTELGDLARLLRDRPSFSPIDDTGPWRELKIHCHYRLEQLTAVLSRGIATKLSPTQQGVWFIESLNLDVFLVTVQKSERDYSPTTMYKDYSISDELFHWQSQSATRADSTKGLRNTNHKRLGVTPVLFVRLTGKDERGETNPYLFLGPVEYVSHTGERPLSIVWRLKHAMPAAFFEEARVAV